MRERENGPRVGAQTWAFADAKHDEWWSPEQICGYLKTNGEPSVSHESLYQRIYADKRVGGTLHLALRCQKARRKRYGGRERRGTIPNQVSIEQRPAIVESRKRFGDWDGDLVIGAGQQQALVTLNERKSRYSLIAHVPLKTAQAVSDAMICLLKPFATCVHTLKDLDPGNRRLNWRSLPNGSNRPGSACRPYVPMRPQAVIARS
jgi:IS30 family transposase